MNLNKGYTVRVSKYLSGHRGVELQFLHAETLEDAETLKRILMKQKGVLAIILDHAFKVYGAA